MVKGRDVFIGFKSVGNLAYMLIFIRDRFIKTLYLADKKIKCQTKHNLLRS